MKKIEEYLHLYLGCECQDTYRQKTGILTGIAGQTVRMDNNDLGSWHISTISPILRPLSDMTDEEALQSGFIMGGVSHLQDRSIIFQAKELLTTNNFFNKQTNISVAEHMQLARYLLKQSFDLFGLIEENLALDKTKI